MIASVKVLMVLLLLHIMMMFEVSSKDMKALSEWVIKVKNSKKVDKKLTMTVIQLVRLTAPVTSRLTILRSLSLAQNSAMFLERVVNTFPLGRDRLLVRSSDSFDYGVVYAAVGESAIRKSSVSASSVRGTMGNRVGTFLVTSEFGLESLAPHASSYGETFWWDRVASVDGFGINFTSLPEFEAFTLAEMKSSSANGISSMIEQNLKMERARKESKPMAWAAVRQLRSAKIAALLLALDVFAVAAIFLDADTMVCDSVKMTSAFEAVSADGPWFAFVPAPSEHHGLILERMFGILKGAGPPEPNTGVVAVSACNGARRVLKRWSEIYWQESLAIGPIQNPMDQPPLRAALFLEDAPWASLHKSLNCRGHVKNLNTALPMRCGGFDAVHWEAIARSSVLHAVGTVQLGGASLTSAKSKLGGKGCAVLHSHVVPRLVQHRTNFQRNALVLLDDNAKRQKVFGFGLEKLSDIPRIDDRVSERFIVEAATDITVPVLHEVVAIFTLLPTVHGGISTIAVAADWRRGDWRNTKVLIGPLAKDACASEPKPCAVVLVLLDPLVRLASDDNDIRNVTDIGTLTKRLHHRAKTWSLRGFTLLDALLPLNVEDLKRLDDPRAGRVNRFGSGNAAEVADAISRLESDAFLVILGADPENSRALLNIAFKARPDARRAAEIALEKAVQYDARGRQAIEHLNSDSKNFIRNLLIYDSHIYDAARRLFDAQCDAARTGEYADKLNSSTIGL